MQESKKDRVSVTRGQVENEGVSENRGQAVRVESECGCKSASKSVWLEGKWACDRQRLREKLFSLTLLLFLASPSNVVCLSLASSAFPQLPVDGHKVSFSVGSYSCACASNFTGVDCERDAAFISVW